MANVMREWGIDWSEAMMAYEVFVEDLRNE